MSGNAAFPGGRTNGLRAANYAPIADLDPRVAEAMLVRLGGVGIAAYVQPTPAAGTGLFDSQVPQRPTDRLFVDDSAVRQASGIVASELPEDALLIPATAVSADSPTSAATTDEERWQQLVQALAAPTDPTQRHWPAAEDLPEPAHPEPAHPEAAHAEAAAHPEPARPEEPGSREPVPFRTWSPPIDPEDEHFVPPEPPPVPRPQPVTAWAIIAMVGGLALLVIPAAFGQPVGGGLATLAIIGLVGGFATLVYRMRDSRDPDSDSDNGAVV